MPFWCTEWRAFNYLQMELPLEHLDDIHWLSPKQSLEWKQFKVDGAPF